MPSKVKIFLNHQDFLESIARSDFQGCYLSQTGYISLFIRAILQCPRLKFHYGLESEPHF